MAAKKKSSKGKKIYSNPSIRDEQRATAQRLTRGAVKAVKKAVSRQPQVRVAKKAASTAKKATQATRAGISSDARRISQQIRNWTG